MKQISSLLVPVLWLVSFFFSLPLIEPYEISRLLALGAGVLALGVVLADPLNRAASLTVTPLVALVSAFLLWCGLTFFWSLSPFVTIIAWGTLCLLPLWFLIFALLPVTRVQIMLALRLAVLGMTLLALWALVQFFLLPQFLTANGSIRYPFADPNNYAGLLNMGLFTALGLLFSTDKKQTRLLWALCGVVMMVALVLIGSRMAMIVSFSGLIIFALLARRSAGFSGKAVLAVFVAGLVMLAVSGLFNTERVTSIERAVDLTSISEDKSVSARTMIWQSTVDLIGQRVMTGSGLGTFYLMYPAVRDTAEIYSSGLMAHADPLQFWAEAGLPATILLYAILIALLAGFIKFLKLDDKNRMLVVALFCALLTLALHMHVTFHLFVASLLTMTGLLMGVLVRLLPPGRPLLTCRVGWLMIDLFLLAVFVVVFQSCLFSEMHTRQGVEAMNRNDVPGFSAKINQAGQEGFGLNPRPYILAASIPLGILQTSTLPSAEREKLFLQADGLLDQGLALSPVNAGAYFSKALLYGAMGRADKSRQFLEQALKIDPRHAQARQMLGR